MNAMFYIAAAVALASTALAITRSNPVYGLLNFVVSLLAVAVVFFTLGAPFAAALEVIVYAGAIMVLFLFVVMMLNLHRAAAPETGWLTRRTWLAPALVAALLGGTLVCAWRLGGRGAAASLVSPQAVGQRLFGAAAPAVEIASFLLLAGLIAAYHLGRPPVTRR